MFFGAAANYAVYYTQISTERQSSESDTIDYELSCLYSTCPSNSSNVGYKVENG